MIIIVPVSYISGNRGLIYTKVLEYDLKGDIVMKILFSVISAIAIMILPLFLFASCTPETPEPPYGVWMSDEPRIVLYFKQEYRVPDRLIYVGFYTIDEVETKVFAHFGRGRTFIIHDLTGITEGGHIGFRATSRLLPSNKK